MCIRLGLGLSRPRRRRPSGLSALDPNSGVRTAVEPLPGVPWDGSYATSWSGGGGISVTFDQSIAAGSRPTYDDLFRKVTFPGGCRNAALSRGGVISGRSSWAVALLVHGDVRGLAGRRVILDDRAPDGSGTRVVCETTGHITVEQYDAAGDAVPGTVATSEDTFWGDFLVESVPGGAVSVDLGARRKMTFRGLGASAFLEGDVLDVVGASSIGTNYAAVTAVEPGGDLPVVFNGTYSAPTAGEIAAGVVLRNTGLIEQAQVGATPGYALTARRLPILLLIERSGDAIRFQFRDRASTRTVPGLPAGPAGSSATIGAQAGSALDSWRMEAYKLGFGTSALTGAQRGAVEDEYGILVSRSGEMQGGGLVAAWLDSWPRIPRADVPFYRPIWLPRDEGGGIPPELAYPDPSDITATVGGAPSSGHNPAASPGGSFYLWWLGDPTFAATEDLTRTLDLVVFGPEERTGDLGLLPPRVVHSGRVATFTIKPTTGWAVASKATADWDDAAMAAVAPYTIWRLAAGVTFATRLNITAAAGKPFRVVGGGPSTVVADGVDCVGDDRSVHNFSLDKTGAGAYYHFVGNAGVNPVRGFASTGVKLINRRAKYGSYCQGQFILFQGCEMSPGAEYGHLLRGLGIGPIGHSNGVLDPLHDASSHLLRTSGGAYFLFAGASRNQPQVVTYGLTVRGATLHSYVSDVATSGWQEGGSNSWDPGKTQRIFVAERLMNRRIMTEGMGRGVLRFCSSNAAGSGWGRIGPAGAFASSGGSIYPDYRAYGCRTGEDPGNFDRYRSAPAGRPSPNVEDDDYPDAGLVAPELAVAERRGDWVLLAPGSAPRGGRYGTRVAYEARPVATGVAAEIPGQGMHDRAAHRYAGACDYRVKVRSLGVDYLPAGEPAYSPWVRVGGVSKLADLTPMLFRLDASDDGTLALGTAAQFTASGAQALQVVSPDDALRVGTGDLLVACWARHDSFAATSMHYFRKYSAISSAKINYHLFWSSSTNRFRFRLDNGAGGFQVVDANAFGAPSVGVWYFVAAYYDRSRSVIGISVNGGPADEAAFSGTPLDDTDRFTVGAAFDGSANTAFHDGAIDQLAICKGTDLDLPALIAQLYGGGAGVGADGAPASATAFYELREPSGTRLDAIGTNHLADVNSVASAEGIRPGGDGDAVLSWADLARTLSLAPAGAGGRPTYTAAGVDFDGSGDSLAIAGVSPAEEYSSWTILALVDLETFGASGSTICEAAGPGGSLALGVTAAGLASIAFDPDSGDPATATSADAIPIGAPAWVGARLDAGGTMTAFVVLGGVVRHGPAATPGAGRAISGATLALGGGTLDGTLARLAVSGKAWPDADLLAAIAGEG